MAFLQSDYHPKWTLIRRMILRRSGNVCAGCGVRNHTVIERFANGTFRYATGCELLAVSVLRWGHGWKYWRSMRYHRLTPIHCAVAHLDRNRANNRFANLRCYCQRCHLIYDLTQHLRSRKYGRHHERPVQLTLFGRTDTKKSECSG